METCLSRPPLSCDSTGGKLQSDEPPEQAAFSPLWSSLPGGDVALLDQTGTRAPLAGPIVHLGRLALVIRHADELRADLGLVRAGVVPAFDEQLGDGHGIAIVLVWTRHGRLHPIHAHVVEYEVTRAAI